MFQDLSIAAYLEEAAARKPTPGGGSVSAVVGALGTSMAEMAANFTLGDAKFEEVQEEIKGILGRLAAARGRLIQLADEDARAYGVLSRAYKLPKKTDQEKAARQQAVQEGLRTAMQPPLSVMRSCAEVLRLLPRLRKIANPNLLSDVRVACILCEAALMGAKLNVAVNLDFLKDKELVQQARDETSDLVTRAAGIRDEVLA